MWEKTRQAGYSPFTIPKPQLHLLITKQKSQLTKAEIQEKDSSSRSQDSRSHFATKHKKVT